MSTESDLGYQTIYLQEYPHSFPCLAPGIKVCELGRQSALCTLVVVVMNVTAIIPSHLVRRLVTVVAQRHVEKLLIGHRSEGKGRKNKIRRRGTT